MSNGDKNFVVKDSGERINYKSGMRRDTQKGKPNYRLIDLDFLKRLAEHLTKGAEKYGRDNWRKANSQEELDRFLDSAFRHLIQYLSGQVDEDHGMATVFNIMAAEHVKTKLEEQGKTRSEPLFDSSLEFWASTLKPQNERVVDYGKIISIFNSMLFDKPIVSLTINDGLAKFNFLWKKHLLVHVFAVEDLRSVHDLKWLIKVTADDINQKYLSKLLEEITE